MDMSWMTPEVVTRCYILIGGVIGYFLCMIMLCLHSFLDDSLTRDNLRNQRKLRKLEKELVEREQRLRLKERQYDDNHKEEL